MTKIVINADFGGFGLSTDAVIRYNQLKGRKVWVMEDREVMFPIYSFVPPEDRVDAGNIRSGAPINWFEMTLEEKGAYNAAYRDQTFNDRDVVRDDPILVQVVEEMGEKADSRFASLKIVEIPDDVEWQIEEYDGSEWIAEKHRTWS